MKGREGGLDTRESRKVKANFGFVKSEIDGIEICTV
jgi:hypothetical protein